MGATLTSHAEAAKCMWGSGVEFGQLDEQGTFKFLISEPSILPLAEGSKQILYNGNACKWESMRLETEVS